MPNPTTRSEAISAKCRDCIYDPGAAGTWRQQVAACESGNCPLFSFRPLTAAARTPEGLRELRGELEQRNRAAVG